MVKNIREHKIYLLNNGMTKEERFKIQNHEKNIINLCDVDVDEVELKKVKPSGKQ